MLGILILGLCFSTLSPLMLYLIQIFPSMNPWWYYGVSASTGLVNWVAVALSALADVLPQKFRAPGIGLLLAGFMLGFSLSPIFALFLSRLHLSLMSFVVVVGGLVSTILFVPETLPPHVAEASRQRREHAHAEDQVTAPKFWTKVGRFVVRPAKEMAILNRNTFFRLISLLAFFSGMVSSGDQVLLLYYVEDRLGFTEKDVSIMFLIIGIVGLLAQGVLLKPLNDCVGEKLVVAICFFVGAIVNTMYGIATNKATIFAAAALSALTGMAFPTISAIKSNNVVSHEGSME
jgi:DHA1 family tetracycline resistance protein-like MFS transporter